MKSIDDFPFQFDADQLFAIGDDKLPQDVENVADDPANVEVLADMKRKLTDLLAPLGQPFGEFGPPYPKRGPDESPRKRKKA